MVHNKSLDFHFDYINIKITSKENELIFIKGGPGMACPRKIFTFFICVMITSFQVSAQEAIRLNQIGFFPDGPKFAVAVGSESDTFYLTSPDLADTVFTGSLGEARVWAHSGESVKIIDFRQMI